MEYNLPGGFYYNQEGNMILVVEKGAAKQYFDYSHRELIDMQNAGARIFEWEPNTYRFMEFTEDGSWQLVPFVIPPVVDKEVTSVRP